MTTHEKYIYAAGIIDGEGHIGIYSHGQVTNLYPSVTVESVDKELIDWLFDLFKIGTISSRKPTTKAPGTYYRWGVVGNGALAVLMAVEPYLVIERKKYRTKLLLDRWPRHGAPGAPVKALVKVRRRQVKRLFEQEPAPVT
jgi:hypothetical protein